MGPGSKSAINATHTSNLHKGHLYQVCKSRLARECRSRQRGSRVETGFQERGVCEFFLEPFSHFIRADLKTPQYVVRGEGCLDLNQRTCEWVRGGGRQEEESPQCRACTLRCSWASVSDKKGRNGVDAVCTITVCRNDR